MHFISGAQIASIAASLFFAVFFASELKAQIITEQKEGETLSGVFRIWEVQKVLLSDTKRLRLELPLPEGEWTLRYNGQHSSTHASSVVGRTIWLDQVRNREIFQSIVINVF